MPFVVETSSVLRRLCLVALLALAGCGSPTSSAAPTGSATGSATPTAAPSASPSTAPAAIEAVVREMASAVMARDRNAYLELVDQSDPVFALEHARWVADWADLHPARTYVLAVDGLTVDDSAHAATGRLTATWTIEGFEAPRTASWAARFTSSAGGWRYAGEIWQPSEADHFRLLVAPGVSGAEAAILPALPKVYDVVTSTLEYAPAGSMQIKVYADAPALVANTLLSLPLIRGWNEPGEALKVFFEPDDPSINSLVAHEFTHFVLFDRAGTKRTRMPWWLDEGTASFVARALEPPTDVPDEQLQRVAEWVAAGELAPWTDMAVFEETPLELWGFVYPQGYAMVAFVTDEYGGARRNAWLSAMATEMTIEAATPAVLGVTFDQLDAAFRAWVLDR